MAQCWQNVVGHFTPVGSLIILISEGIILLQKEADLVSLLHVRTASERTNATVEVAVGSRNKGRLTHALFPNPNLISVASIHQSYRGFVD